MEEKRFTLRMNNEIFEKVKEEAEKERRSTAKQIELILDEYFREKEKEYVLPTLFCCLKR